MNSAFAKHNLSLVLWAALWVVLAWLTIPAAGALAETGGSAPTPTQPGRRALATWFGPGFYGHQTACGQTMSPALVGVASRTLPCGTLVRVGYRGQQLTVPVLDRGPYGHIGAAWDLTAGAARALDIRETVHVVTEIVGELPNTPSLGQPLQAGLPAGSSTASTPSEATTAAATGGAAAG
jgi:rare lipoprotein A (peptidoglycan hydrolase)